MPEKPSINPYEAPADWKVSSGRHFPEYLPILRRWRPLRSKYNLIMLAVGFLSILPILSAESFDFLFLGAIMYGIPANLCFTLGVIPEILLTFVTRENDHPALRRIVFITGLLLSVSLTLFLALNASGAFW